MTASDKDEPEKQSATPSAVQRAYLKRGLRQPGGKLPLFDQNGQAIKAQTIRACMKRGWAQPWYPNAIKPDWLVCRLTALGRNSLQRPTIKRTTVKKTKT